MLPPRLPLANILSKNHWFVIFGTSSFTLGLILIFVKSWIIEVLTASVIVLKPNTMLEDVWRKTPVDVPISIYLFNWTNPEAVHDINVKPKFQEVGPYTFNQQLEKKNIVWNDNNTVTYNQIRTFSYDNKNPNGDLSDNITSINAITMASSHYIQNWNYFFKRMASVFISTAYPSIDITRTANQLLLEGYNDIIVNIYNYLPFLASEIPRFDKFGWLFILNGSSAFEGAINMDNGVEGDFEIREWNYNSKIPQFEGSCSKIRGSAGELFPRKISTHSINVFIPHICRSLKFDYEGTVFVHGILGYKYSMGDGMLDNGTLIPENKCYCSGECIPSGLFNISSCRYGLPAYGSLPHFHKADPFYLRNIDGLKPDEDKHQSYIILEPTTGVPLEATIRAQLNMHMHPVSDIMVFENLPEIYFPLFWLETSVSLPGYMIIMLKIYLMAPHILLGIAIVLIFVGLYIILFKAYKPMFVSLYKQLRKRKRPNSVKPEEVPLRNDVEMAYINPVEIDEWEKTLIGKFTMR